jgi:hypothetical protein
VLIGIVADEQQLPVDHRRRSLESDLEHVIRVAGDNARGYSPLRAEQSCLRHHRMPYDSINKEMGLGRKHGEPGRKHGASSYTQKRLTLYQILSLPLSVSSQAEQSLSYLPLSDSVTQ